MKTISNLQDFITRKGQNFTTGKQVYQTKTRRTGYWMSSDEIRETSKYYYICLSTTISKNGTHNLGEWVLRAKKEEVVLSELIEFVKNRWDYEWNPYTEKFQLIEY